jgi:hypothetical protein
MLPIFRYVGCTVTPGCDSSYQYAICHARVVHAVIVCVAALPDPALPVVVVAGLHRPTVLQDAQEIDELPPPFLAQFFPCPETSELR